MENFILEYGVCFDLLLAFIENILLIKFIDLFFEKKRNISVLLACLLTLISIFLHYIVPTAYHVYISFFMIILLIIYCRVNLYGTWLKEMVTIFGVYVNLFVIDILVVVIGFIFGLDISQYMGTFNLDSLVITLITKCILVIEYVCIKNFLHKKSQISNRTLNLMICLLIASVILPEIFLTKYISHTEIDLLTFLIGMLDFLVICFLIFKIYGYLIKDYQKMMEQDVLLETLNHEKRILKVIEEKTEEMNKLNHDLNNHKLTMLHLLKEKGKEAADQYLDDLLPESSTYVYTKNEVLNYILNEKMDLAESLGIDVKCFIEGGIENEISDVDLSVLFGNLLDNAINAAKEAEKKFIDIKIKKDDYKMVISIINSYTNLDFRNEKYYSTTKGKGHGYGLSNIKQIVEKYNGHDYIEHDDKVFKHICIFLLMKD